MFKECVTFQIQDNGGSPVQHNYQQEPVMSKFKRQIQPLRLLQIKHQPQIQKIKKRIQAFAKQYGEKTQKTTSIFMNYLQTVRQIGVSFLRTNQCLRASSYFAQCLKLIDPKHDQIFYQKFLIIKIDALNKLLYCLFELQGGKVQNQDNNQSRYENALKITDRFIIQLKEFPNLQSLKKSQNCMLEVSYFYYARLFKKNQQYDKAIAAFEQSLSLIQLKLSTKQNKNEQNRSFWRNLRVKIYYKISKCYRCKGEDIGKIKYEQIALKQVQKIGNPSLQYYIRKKIQFFQAKIKFREKLKLIDGKRRIQQQVGKAIEQFRQCDIQSLYYVYNMQPCPRK